MYDDLIELFNSNRYLGKQLIDTLPTAVYVTDAEGRLSYYNSAAVEFSGREPELGDDRWCVSWKLYHTDGSPMPPEECPLSVSLKEGHSLNGVEGIAERPNGERRWFRAYPSPLRNDNGDIIGGINMLIDISDQKQTEEELRDNVDELEQQKRLYEAVSSSMPDLIYIFDLNYRFMFANDALLEMWGRTREEALGKGMRELGYEPWHAEMHEREVDEVIDTKEPVQGEVSFPHDKLGERYYDYIFFPVLDDQGEVEAVAGITRDITERRQAKEALRKNRDRLRAAFEIETVGVLFWGGEDFTITEANDTFLDMCGYSREEILGKSWRELTPEEHYPVSEQGVADLKESGYVEPYEKEFFRKDGSRWWGLCAPRRINDNEVVEFLLDITDRKEAEQEREQLLKQVETEKERLSEIFRQAPSFMCIQRGPDHVYERANDLYRELVGGRKLIGKPVREVFPDLEGQGYFELLDRVYETGEPYVGTGKKVVLKHPDSDREPEERYLDFVYQPLRGPDGEVNGIFTQGVDLTERKKVKEELKEMNKTLEQRVKERTQKLHSYQKQLQSLASQLNKAEEQERQRLASELHDNLGQMLTVAKMKVDGLQHGQSVDQTSSEMAELKQVVDDALKYNQNLMTELKPPPALHKEDVTEVLYWTVKKMEKQGLDITIEDDGRHKPVDKEVRSMLHQSVRELLHNVSKHADTSKVRLSVLREKDQVKVTVEDKGKGFDMDDIPAPTEGGRFGLFNIRERINWHGGTFKIHSEPGNGTKATLYAPLKKKEQIDEAARDAKKPSTPSDKKERQTELWQKINVLLVDDHEMVRRGLRQMIEKQDDMTVVAEASNGHEAVELAYVHSPHVIIMDVNMPVMDGIEATKKIKSDMPNIRIIGLSLHDSQEVIQDMQSAGTSGYLTKDEAFETLCKTIRSEATEL